jgi:integrase
MSVYKRGDIWWYEFVFRGVRVRESSNSPNKGVCERIQRERRRSMELGTGGLQEIKRPELFSIAVKKWQEVSKAHWSESNVRVEDYNVEHLLPHFSKKLLTDITADDVSRYQAARKKDGASPKTINMEVGTLRSILRKHRLWAQLQPDVRMLKARGDIGRSLTADEQVRLLVAAEKSRSRSLYPAVQLSLHTGLRSSELRNMKWRQIDLLERTLTVGKSKTTGGDGRIVPLSKLATQCLQEWRSLFPDAQPVHYVFPSERYGLNGEDG